MSRVVGESLIPAAIVKCYVVVLYLYIDVCNSASARWLFVHNAYSAVEANSPTGAITLHPNGNALMS